VQEGQFGAWIVELRRLPTIQRFDKPQMPLDAGEAIQIFPHIIIDGLLVHFLIIAVRFSQIPLSDANRAWCERRVSPLFRPVWLDFHQDRLACSGRGSREDAACARPEGTGRTSPGWPGKMVSVRWKEGIPLKFLPAPDLTDMRARRV